jgi:hypothetical protein
VRPPSVKPPASAKAPSVRPPASAGPVISAKSQPFEDAPATTRTPAEAKGAELTLDMGALERNAKDSEQTAPVFEPKHDLPPPPQNLLRDKSVTGNYRTLTPTPEERAPSSSRKPPSIPPRKAGSVPPGKPASSPPGRQMPPFSAKPPGKPPGSRPGDGRYAPARPAAIFGPPSRPVQNQAPSSSLFGEDLISDKSLDEVILSYLAEDLEPGDKKKR